MTNNSCFYLPNLFSLFTTSGIYRKSEVSERSVTDDEQEKNINAIEGCCLPFLVETSVRREVEFLMRLVEQDNW